MVKGGGGKTAIACGHVEPPTRYPLLFPIINLVGQGILYITALSLGVERLLSSGGCSKPADGQFRPERQHPCRTVRIERKVSCRDLRAQGIEPSSTKSLSNGSFGVTTTAVATPVVRTLRCNARRRRQRHTRTMKQTSLAIMALYSGHGCRTIAATTETKIWAK